MNKMQDIVDQLLTSHLEWVKSEQTAGRQFNIDDPQLAGINWPEISLCEAHLPEAQFINAPLAGVDLYASCFAGAQLDGAILNGNNMRNANFNEASLRGASLVGVLAARTTFTRAVLRSANLQGAELIKGFFASADLRDADLRNANLHNATLTGAQFAGAQLTGARGLEAAIIEWIDVGAEEPLRLDGMAAIEWLRQAASGG